MAEGELDHRSFIASLSPIERQRLTHRSDRPGLAHLAMHWGAILALGWLIVARVPAWPLLIVLQGVLIVFLFTLMHETAHRTAFATRWVNDGVAAACGILIALPPTWFRYFHFAHHRHTQDPERDPELSRPKPETWGQYLRHISGLPIWWSHGRTLARNALGRCDDAFVPTHAFREVRREARMMIAGYALVIAGSVAAGSADLMFVWVLPALLGQPVLRLYLLAEHGRCPFVANMFENSRTTYTNRLVRLLAWNMPFHAEHHAYPAVPFHRLPELHRLAREHLCVTERGYTKFNLKYTSELQA